ncbi:MAG TPA: transcriptional regulator [Xanthobacteraceae bacterium]|nr:transcriptional regulator [Xanthobacteraceae bacterium]
MASSNPMDKAAAAFKKEEQRREGAKNMAEFQAAQLAEQKKIERLRALRLAHEAQQAEIEAAAPAAKPKAAAKKKSTVS